MARPLLYGSTSMRCRSLARLALLTLCLTAVLCVLPRRAFADTPNVAARRQCASLSLGFAGTYIGGSTSEYHYHYDSMAADLRAEYRYCAWPNIELGAGLGTYVASNWHSFTPAAMVRGYIGPSSRAYGAGLHVRGGATILDLPHGSLDAPTSDSGPLTQDTIIAGPSVSGGLDYQGWFTEHTAIEMSADAGIAFMPPNAPGGDHDMLAFSLSVGIVAGW